MAVPQLQVRRPQRRPRPFEALYPNPNDPCNRRMLEDAEMPRWDSVPLEKTPTNEEHADKYAEFYELQRRDMERIERQQGYSSSAAAAAAPTSLPQRAQTAPLHAHSAHTPRAPVLSHQTTMAASRPSLPSVRQHRHSTTAVPGDIESSSSGLRPRVNYKSLYNRSRNLSASSASSSCHSIYEHCEDVTDSTMMMGSSGQFEEDPVPAEEDSHPPQTMEIAPNVRVAVRSEQESYRAVQSGDYTVATCFACTSTIVCVDDAAYVLCPDCHVVSPLGYGSVTTIDSSKKDDPYGIGTGLKREWVNQYI